MAFRKEKLTLKSLASKYPMVLLMGPRENGKAELARQAFPQKSFIDLDDKNILQIAKNSPKTFLMAFSKGAVINEAGRIPTILEDIKYHVDRLDFEPGRFILISSRKLKTSDMGGRLAKMELLGLTAEDMEEEHFKTHNPFQLIQKGQIQGVLEGRTEISNFVRLCVQKDFSGHINTSNTQAFEQFIAICARSAASGARLSVNSLAREARISAPTAKTWLALLEDYIIINIIHESKNPSRANLYFNDSGLLCSLLGISTPESLILSPFRDAVVKSYAVSELLKGRGGRALEPNLNLGSSQSLTADWKERCELFIEPNIEISREKIKKIQKAARIYGRKIVVLYLGDITYSTEGIDIISFRDWTKLSGELNCFS